MTGQLAAALPFGGVLLSFAVLPGVFPRFWHRRMGAVTGGWVGLELALQSGLAGPAPAIGALWRAAAGEFLPFITPLLALYALGGGIAITGGPWGRPAGNLLLLVLGTLLASLMGTIGASLLLIHPLLAANARRPERRHLVLAFIVLVGNSGGALSPLGDPPLLVGFLRGVPFFWPAAHLWAPLLLVAAPVLALVFAVDMSLARGETPPPVAPPRVRGGLNILLLLLLMAAIPLAGIWQPGTVCLLSARLPGAELAMTLLAGLCIAVSEAFTPRAIRAHNRFAWAAMREIGILFFAIFATIGPVLALLRGADLPESPVAWFWASGIASALLDAAPTYLIFFQAAGGDAARLVAAKAELLTALSAGSVFFGPITYLGNAPNLLIRAIASHRGVRMPGFFSYAAVMALLLAPALWAIPLLLF